MTGHPVDILAEAARLRAEGRAFALVTVVRTSGSTPRHAGAKMIVLPGGDLVGTVGGGRWENEVARAATRAIARGAPELVRFHLTHELAMCCGGEMEVFVDVSLPAPELVVFGAGHVSMALAPLARRVGFEVAVVDEAEDMATEARFPDARVLVHDFDPSAWKSLRLLPSSFVVIATRDHAVDQAILEALVGRDLAYLGVIGSRGKAGRFARRLEAKGIADERIKRVRMPMGVEIHAETPEEIAVSIVAELIQVRNAGRPRAAVRDDAGAGAGDDDSGAHDAARAK